MASLACRKWHVKIVIKQSWKQLLKTQWRACLDAIKPQHHVKSGSVPFSRQMRQLLTLRKFWKNSLNDPFVFPADQNDPRQSLYFSNQRRFVVNTKASKRD